MEENYNTQSWKEGDWIVRTTKGDSSNKVTEGKAYQFISFSSYRTVYVIDDTGEKDWFNISNFRLARPDEIPRGNKNSLPKYWVVQCNTRNPNWRKVIDYLNKVYYRCWNGDAFNYYGYDGGNHYNGTNGKDNITSFQNNPTLLTIEQFVEMTEGFVLPEYVEYIDTKYKGQIVKVEDWKCGSYCKIIFYNGNKEQPFKHLVKPSTKEAFDKQNQKQEIMIKITHTQAQQIIDIACITWKHILFDWWGKDIVLKNEIQISDDVYQKMRKACTLEQNVLFDEIFGKDVQYIPEGTPCLGTDGDDYGWRLCYSDGNGRFKWTPDGKIDKFEQVQVLDINNLPKY